MKKIASFLLLALALTGCYKDKGNYEYTLDTMNEILKVTFSPAVENKVIEVQQPLTEDDTIRVVKAFVEQSLAKNLDNLEFYWCRSYVNEQGKAVKDTIRTRDSLVVKLPVGKDMSYDVFLEIYDRTTDLSHYSKFTIATRPVFKNSLFVLHGGEGERKIGNIEVIGDEKGWVKAVKCIRMELGEPDESGRRSPVAVPGSEFEIETETVIMSLGTSPNPLIARTTAGLETNRRGCLVADENGATTRPGVFAGGDAVTGAATVILAMGAGRKAAAAIHEYVQNK